MCVFGGTTGWAIWRLLPGRMWPAGRQLNSPGLEAQLPQDSPDQLVVCYIYRWCPYLTSISISSYTLDIHSVYLSIIFGPLLLNILYIHYISLSHCICLCIYIFFFICSTSCPSLYILYIWPPHSVHFNMFYILILSDTFYHHCTFILYIYHILSIYKFYIFILYITFCPSPEVLCSFFTSAFHILSNSIHSI